MKYQRLDDFVKAKLDGEIQPPGDMWSRIEDLLDKNSLTQKSGRDDKKTLWSYYKRIISVGLAASIFVFAGLYVFIADTVHDMTSVTSATTGIRQTVISPASPAIVPDNYLDDNPSLHPNSSANNYSSVIRQNQIAINQSVQNYYKKESVDRFVPHPGITFSDSEEQVSVNVYAHKSPSVNIGSVPHHSSPSGLSYNNDSGLEKNSRKFVDLPELNDFPIVVKEKNKIYVSESSVRKSEIDRRSVVAVGGGYNYGTLHQGYSLTLSTKKDLNNKWYVEGNMGVVYNEAGNNQSKYAGDFLSFKKNLKSNTNSIVMDTRFYNPDDYVFVQMNPIFGYKVSSRFNVGAGPDYQQLITNLGQDIIYFPMMASGKLLPRSDFGVVGKAEFRFSHRVKAGIMYREGMTSYLRNNINIQNRSYFQFQLNYILHKK